MPSLFLGTSGTPFFFATLVIRILFSSVGAAASGDRSRLATAPTRFPEVPFNDEISGLDPSVYF